MKCGSPYLGEGEANCALTTRGILWGSTQATPNWLKRQNFPNEPLPGRLLARMGEGGTVQPA